MKARSLMVLGTASNVGKSFIAAGLCRLLSNQGVRVAPFKAQNMSNNSFVTDDGGEIGRAQAVQAECARVKPSVHMNPVLLKPSADNCSQVIVHGKAIGNFRAREYYANRKQIEDAIRFSYEKLAAEYDVLILEGAGSPAEVNLKKNDVVNMNMAEMADARCILVGDIDRGGVFAQLLGTLNLLEPHEQDRIDGFIVNKFRGDQSLFDDGIKFLEQKSGKKVLGVLPYQRDIWLEEEDGVAVERPHPNPLPEGEGKSGDPLPEGEGWVRGQLEIAVVQLPRMSNFTDFEIFRHELGVRLHYIRSAADFGSPDLVILPGTKATVADLQYLHESGLTTKVKSYVESGGRVLGICGGYQMMGEKIIDRQGIESREEETPGLGFFKMTTEFHEEKILRNLQTDLNLELFASRIAASVQVYEIHLGRTTHQETYAPFGPAGAIHPSGKIAGTYYHGLFESGEFRTQFLNALAQAAGKTRSDVPSPDVSTLKEQHYERLAALLSSNLSLHFFAEKLLLKKSGLCYPSIQENSL